LVEDVQQAGIIPYDDLVPPIRVQIGERRGGIGVARQMHREAGQGSAILSARREATGVR